MSVRGEGEGKTALITGASSGIGLELARVFASHAFDLVLVARTETALHTLADEITEECGVRAHVVPMDLLAPDAPRRLFDEVASRGIPIEVLVNNAGIMEFGALRAMSVEQLLAMVNLNVGVTTVMTRLFLEPMVEGGGGRIMNVGSVGAFQPMPSMAVYAATKAFILSLSEALSEELKGTGVTVTAFCPGFTSTHMLDNIEGVQSVMERLPPGAVMEPDEVAREGYRACMDAVPVKVAGVSNQLTVRLLGWQPRWLVRSLGGLIGRRVL